MTDRIGELAKQASAAVAGNSFSMQRYNEKFAELIIKECFDKLEACLDPNLQGNLEVELFKYFGVK